MRTVPEIFSWKDFCKWQHFVRDTFPKMTSEPLKAAICEGKDGFQYVDDVLYFAKFYEKFGNYSEMVESLLNRFYERFAFVKMYHCCHPLSVESYYDVGIRVLSMSEMNNRFEKIFLSNPKFPQVTESHIQSAIQHMAGSYKRQGYVYFGMDDRFLVNHCGHYLIAGSEYLQSLAAFIERETGCDLKSELRQYGKPTVFEVQVPICAFSEGEFRDLAYELLHTWAYNVAHSRTYSYELDFGIEIDHGLPSDNIIGHYHPKRIPDPSNYYEMYCFEEDER